MDMRVEEITITENRRNCPVAVNYSMETERFSTTELTLAQDVVIISLSSSLIIEVEGKKFRATQDYAVWIPANITHKIHKKNGGEYFLLTLTQNPGEKFPEAPCTIVLNKLSFAIMQHISTDKLRYPLSIEDDNLIAVLSAQIAKSYFIDNFLPDTSDPYLQKVLEFIKQNPGECLHINEIAKKFSISPKTLNRRCLKYLNMTLSEWRLRKRIIVANKYLNKGYKVDVVAQLVGYSTASAFIAMYHRITGRTPANRI